MAYVNGFENDVFLSYAHKDNSAWLLRFHERLEATLTQRLGRPVKVWRDEGMQRNEAFEDSIRDALRGSALFVALGSPLFFGSDYCRKEVDFFAKQAAHDGVGLHMGKFSRIFTVLQLRIDHLTWFEPCRGHNTYEFFTGAPDGLGSRLSSRSAEYSRRIEQLADEVIRTLKQLADEKRPAQIDTAPAETGFQVIFADVPDHLEAFRARIVKSLVQSDISVRPLSGEALPDCSLSIHLLSRNSDRRAMDQLRSALERASRQIVWLDPRCDAPETEKDLWKDLLQQAQDQKSCDLIQDRQQEALSDLTARACKIRQKCPGIPFGPKKLMFDIHKIDTENAFELLAYLNENHGVPLINWDKNRPLVDLKEFEQKILQARGLVVFYGNVHAEWVEERLKTAIKLVQDRNHRLPILGVFLAPPPRTEPKTAIDIGIPVHLEFMDNTTGFRKETLEPILTRVVGGLS